jgi:hypothetical protein
MRDNWLSNRVFASHDSIVDQLLGGLEQARRSTQAHHDHPVAANGRVGSDQCRLV